MNKQLEQLLSDMTYNSKFVFLDEGKDKSELADIAKKRGIKLPAHDLSCFKCIYAFVDRQNLNGCTLPREEVEKALDTLVGKAIDFDHFRKRVVGYWIDAILKGSEIIAYGMFFKGNFQEDFSTIKELMEKDTLGISFEAWGNRIQTSSDGYSLTEIEFAGGALLLKESPAFPGSEVLELAKSRVLEFAKVMTAPKTFVHGAGDKPQEEELPELARLFLYDAQMIARLMGESDCPVCHEKGMMDLLNMNYEANSGKVKCLSCGTTMQMDFTPKTDVTKKGKPRQLKSITTMANLAMLEDIVSYINGFEGTDEALEMAIATELEFEESKLGVCKNCGEPCADNKDICPECKDDEEDNDEDGKKLTYQERKAIDDDQFAVILSTKNKINGEQRKIRMFPIHDPAHVRNALARLAQSKVQQTLQKLGVSLDNVRRKILTKAKELKMKDLLERYKKGSVDELVQMFAMEIAGRELTKEEMEKAALAVKNIQDIKGTGTASPTSLLSVKGQPSANPTSIQNASLEDEIKDVVKEVSGVKAKEEAAAKEAADAKAKEEEAEKAAAQAKEKEDLAKAMSDLTAAVEKIKALEAELATFHKEKEDAEKAKVDAEIKSRRDELGEFAKDMKDEEILDATKYELAKLKKENSDLKAGKKVEAASKPTLTKGSADKEVNAESASRAKINKLAFPSQPGEK